YAPMAGVEVLREAISNYKLRTTGKHYDAASEITITTGALQALHCAIAAVVSLGDEVIVFDPAFDSYCPIIELYGGIPVVITLEAPLFEIPWDMVKKKVSRKTKAILLNSPNNPTGKIITTHDILALDKITEGSDICIISDEVYEHTVFDGKKHLSLSQCESLANRSFVISSLGKHFHVTGWRVGYCLAPKKMMQLFRKVHQFSVFSSSCTALQMALAKQMNNFYYYQEINSLYQQQRQLFMDEIAKTLFKPLPVNGSFFCLLDYSEISDKTELEMAKSLTVKYGVALVPLSSFYTDRREQSILRACFVKKEETIKKAMSALKKASEVLSCDLV
ncbi:MAG: aminotransferase class I/II-fold pyridoxal phosphate-dependent enzyme, partial [Bacteroidetes bacterium]|nr:aminotransferase class I/II-fold pyridoxal phosphate-dependent enzyme [Bacteroidota bacterium]